jgi:hypothetical protein
MLVWNIEGVFATMGTIANQNEQRIAEASQHRDCSIILEYATDSVFACSESRWTFKLSEALMPEQHWWKRMDMLEGQSIYVFRR